MVNNNVIPFEVKKTVWNGSRIKKRNSLFWGVYERL